jgi:coatomer protein complex subunit alpha (xenin)
MFRNSIKSPILLSYSQKDNAFLVLTDIEGGSWEFYTLPKRSDEIDYCNQTKKGKGIAGTFISINRFAILTKEKTIDLYNVKTGESKQIQLKISGVKNMFKAQTGRVLLKTDEKIYLYDFEQVKIKINIRKKKYHLLTLIISHMLYGQMK